MGSFDGISKLLLNALASLSHKGDALMKLKKHYLGALGVLLGLVLASACAPAQKDSLRFEISFPESMQPEPITGRVFVMISRTDEPEPRLQVGSWSRETPFFGADVEQLQPGEVAVINGTTLGFPLTNLGDIPAGEYYVQALINIYTEFERSDGHVIWAHMDQWEGQHFERSPGNLYSEIQKVRLDPKSGYTVALSLDRKIPPVEVPPDTEWVKRVKIQSDLLTEFWGHPIYFGATVLLPKGYNDHPDVHYPVVYLQGHFSLDNPFGFSTEETMDEEEAVRRRRLRGHETGYELYQSWISDDFPRVIAVTFQHPTPYFDDSYAVNSVNNGPYGDALLQELIPYLEENFRMIPKGYARVLTGGSTGGWESLALQVYHPDFFGGSWPFYPDPIDFRRYLLGDIYEDDNAFLAPGYEWFQVERYFRRDPSGQPLTSVRQLSQLEAVLGSKGRSAQQLDIWAATYGPVGEDGYPKPLWDHLTGEIDHDVADYMRDHGYDLSHYIETNWPEIGPKLVGKLRIYCGDMDHYYLNEAVYLLEEFLESTTDPYYDGAFIYGRPQKGHGWHPMTNAELMREMAEHITARAPRGEDTSTWKYR